MSHLLSDHDYGDTVAELHWCSVCGRSLHIDINIFQQKSNVEQWHEPANELRELTFPHPFNALSSREKWRVLRDGPVPPGTWVCARCGEPDTAKPLRAVPFEGAAIRCGECGSDLTHRTPGGRSDPFNWALVLDDGRWVACEIADEECDRVDGDLCTLCERRDVCPYHEEYSCPLGQCDELFIYRLKEV